MPKSTAKRLTDLTVEKLAPLEPGKRREVGDALTPGLVLRVSSPRNKTWNLVYRVREPADAGGRTEWVKGPLKRISLGQWPVVSLEAARQKAREAMKLADGGTDPADARDEAAAKRKAGTFAAVLDRFVELYVKQNTKEGRFARDRAKALAKEAAGQGPVAKGPKSKPGRPAAERIIADNVPDDWRGRMIETITRAEVHELLDDVTTRHGEARARELRKHLGKLFNWAADRGHIPASPMSGMRRPELGYVARERVLSINELQRVWAAAKLAGSPG